VRNLVVPAVYRDQVLIRRPVLDDEASIRAADGAMSPWAFSLDLAPDETFSAWIARRAAEEAGEVPAGRVPAAFRVAEVDGVVVGRSSIRFALNDWLAEYGGHVGYGVIPDYRGKGLATQLLRDSLSLLRPHVEHALIVCDDDNSASAAVAERCGGVLSQRLPGESGVLIRHYLVPTGRSSDAT
jgi:predicted acetyltransferase